MKKAIIFGVTDQDGSYLADLLLCKGYEVHGIIRRSSTFNTSRIDYLMEVNNFKTHYGDVTDPISTSDLIKTIRPDEIYNLSAQSHVKVSFEIPYYTAQVDALGTLNILEAIRLHNPTSKLYQASTSEMFGGMDYNMPAGGYTEDSTFHPRSPYGCAKIYSYWIVKNYRESYNLFTCNGLLFNHESPRRGETFVTRKITTWCAKNYNKIVQTLKGNNILPNYFSPLTLGNLNAYRDWGHSKDYCYAMYLMLQQPKCDDYVIATGETHTVKEFVEKCFNYMNMKIVWQGSNENEVGYVNGVRVVKIDPKYYRPAEVEYLLGNPSKAKRILGWKPEFSFNELVNDMMSSDFKKEGINLQ